LQKKHSRGSASQVHGRKKLGWRSDAGRDPKGGDTRIEIHPHKWELICTVQQRLTLFESLCSNCKMLRTSTIIVITKIMVEVLKMNLLLWCFRAAARMAMTTTRDVVPSRCHHTETL
jgi:hypothetical protein